VNGRVHFIGAGPGDPELCTLRGRRLIGEADLVLLADSLVHPGVAAWARPGAQVLGTSGMALEEVVGRMVGAARAGRAVARVHSGDPSLYGALHEQMAALDAAGVPYEVVPGVSSVFAAAAALRRPLTVPGVSQTVVLTREAGRTEPACGETLAFFLSLTTVEAVAERLRDAGYPDDTPAAVCHRVTWEGERILRTTLGALVETVRSAGLTRHGILLAGEALAGGSTERSRLYDAAFSHLFRRGRRP
jgi:precorrin-4/cobalt-precorrin-4 C11-methyltransferase